MRLGYLVLLAAIVLLSSFDAGQSTKYYVGQTNILNEDPTPPGVSKHFLRASSDATGNVDDEESGVNGITQALLGAQIKLKSKPLKSDAKIMEHIDTFKVWYKMKKTPEDVWKTFNLQPIARGNFFGGIAKLKANQDYQQYLLYEQFYKIVKNQIPKN